VAVLGAAAVGAFAHPVAVLVTLAVVTAVVSATTTLPAALGTAAVSWGLYSGFVVDQFGQLTLDGRTALAALVLVSVALLAVGVVTLVRHAPTQVGQLPPPVRG
jgi:hypothetical protein